MSNLTKKLVYGVISVLWNYRVLVRAMVCYRVPRVSRECEGHQGVLGVPWGAKGSREYCGYKHAMVFQNVSWGTIGCLG